MENAFGHTTLDTICVDLTYGDGSRDTLELVIEPDVILCGNGEWRPGAVERREYYADHPRTPWATGACIGEVIAYAINEGRVIADSISDPEGSVEWRVQEESVEVLRKYGLVDQQRALLTEDGFLFLEVYAGLFSDGDLELGVNDLTADGIAFEDISDIDARPALAERVARIRATLRAAGF